MSYAFEPGVQYELQNVGWYLILRVLSTQQILVRNIMTEYEEAHNIEDLLVKWDEGQLAFGMQGRNLREVEGSPIKTSYEFTDLDFLRSERHGDELIQETWDKYLLIQRLVDLPRMERTDGKIEKEVKRFVAEQLLLMLTSEGERTILPFPRHSGKGNKEVLQKDAEEPLLLRLHDELGSEEFTFDLLLTSQLLLLISARQVRRWIEEFEKSGRDIRSLVPTYDKRGMRGVQLDPEVAKKLKEAVEIVFLTEQRVSVKKVIDKLAFLILDANSKRPDDQPQLVEPNKRKIYRYIDELDPMEVDIARLGRRAAQRKHAQHCRGPRPPRPNARWEEDDTLLDLLVVDKDDGLPIGRPWLTAVRDKHSGVIPGFSVSFEPPSTQTVMECLFYAIPEKRHVKELFELRHDFVGYGVPETLAVDRGSGYLNNDMELACAQLHIELDAMPGRSPWLKGSIEEFLGEVETDLIHPTPGTTFSNFLVRGDYDPAKHACVTLDGLWYLLHKWVVDDYTRDRHKGLEGKVLGGVPAKIWERALGLDFVPRLPASRNELAVLLSRVESRVIQSNGIEFEYLWYQDSRLGPLSDILNKTKPHIPVRFKYNPGDLARIWVMYPSQKRYLEVLAIDQEYTQGLSLWKHRVIMRYIGEEMERDIDRVSLILAREELHQAIYGEFRQGKKLKGRKGAARFLDIRVNEILRRAQRSDPDSAETSEFSQYIDFDLPVIEVKNLDASELPTEQEMVAPEGIAETSVAQLGVPLPTMVEGVTLPENKEIMEVGAHLPEPKKPLPEQKESTEKEAVRAHKTPKVNTDPDESTSFGISYSYGHHGPT
jgi:putative transposase